MYESDYEEQKRRERHALRIQQMKKEKQRAIMIQNCVKVAVPIVIVLLLVVFIITKAGCNGGNQEPDSSQDGALQSENVQQGTSPQSTSQQTGEAQTNILPQEDIPQDESLPQDNMSQDNTLQGVTGQQGDTLNEETVSQDTAPPHYSAATTEDTLQLGDDFASQYALFIDLESSNILAEKNAYTRISPASMTKVLTVLVAAEHIAPEQLDDTFTFTLEITDYAYVNDCSCVGFLDEETVTVRDLFYGTVLPSGGDAAVGLAVYVAGSQEAFIEMMNEKLEELGLSDTAHFTNCVGLYDEEHYCTLYDMAIIMEAALENDICREVMAAHTYTTSATEQHPEGILISNWFLRRIEDKDTGGEVLCAKTGYVDQSGSCAVSYGIDSGGKEYICVTANASSSWRCIYDHVDLYLRFATGGD